MVSEKAVRYRNSIRNSIIRICALIAFIALPVVALGVQPSHLDKSKNPYGCSACHKGHGRKGTPMLNASKQEFCFTCHGLITAQGKVKAKTNMYSVFNKSSRHPVLETYMYHIPNEELPETNPSAKRHVACGDCHMVHEITPENKWAKVRGYSGSRTKPAEASSEREICYRCHADSANLPFGSTNKMWEFDRNNASYHPVEAPGKNLSVPSLKGSLNVRSTITCSDCHGNDDPFGPKGPHGSNYEFLLKEEYTTRETAESPDAYELCYSCHRRTSILGNESFQKHREHVVYQHIPCAACHTSHGTDRNPHLIDFDSGFVSGTPMPSYLPSGDGRPMCLLACHVGGTEVLHDRDFYDEKLW